MVGIKGIFSKLSKHRLSFSILIIIMFMFIVTNFAYMELTKKALINEGNKRFDLVAEYVRYYLGNAMDNEQILTPEDISGQFESLMPSVVNTYDGKRLTLDFTLYEVRDFNFNKLSELTRYGDYLFPDERDYKYLRDALESNTNLVYTYTYNGKEIEKYFMPLTVKENRYVLLLSSDYKLMTDVIYDQVFFYIFTIIICSAVFAVLCYIVYYIFIKHKENAVMSVHSEYKGSMENLFRTIREQRHDYNNHLCTVHAFVTLKKYDALQKYVENLVGETDEINDILNIDCPAIIALVQAKKSQAVSNNINFEYQFFKFTGNEFDHIKAIDLVKILGNLIDNSFEAIKENTTKDNRHLSIVKLTGKKNGRKITFTVYNNGPQIPENELNKIFASGYTTKKHGSGLGLSIVKKIVDKNNGFLFVESESYGTSFIVEFSV
ncbi:Ca2+/Na+ antiporter [Fontibacillus solani]|uniref:histidine kinase n=1 Tax=Fontibacillus solani TaxID=1572857 RepID=A0A7W3SPY5_9BACL|nr:ATP-binding protein [Fontibacillus solani]MBA9083963.1 Ca2+/Na+ antiporter [Fontibacillus solani]